MIYLINPDGTVIYNITYFTKITKKLEIDNRYRIIIEIQNKDKPVSFSCGSDTIVAEKIFNSIIEQIKAGSNFIDLREHKNE